MNKSRTWFGWVAILFFVIADSIHDLLRPYSFYRNLWAWSAEVVSILRNLLQICLVILGMFTAHGVRVKAVLQELGLVAPFMAAFTFAFVASLPMLIGFGSTPAFNPQFSLSGILAFTIISPFAEELLFRGYLFRQLYQRAGWGFWPAALITAAIFGIGHIYQAFIAEAGAWGLIGIVAITGAGSVFFSWLFLRWDFNLWVPVFVHCFMNLWWEVFAVDETALGGWLANIARTLTILLAIIITRYRKSFWKLFQSHDTETSEQTRRTGNHKLQIQQARS